MIIKAELNERAMRCAEKKYYCKGEIKNLVPEEERASFVDGFIRGATKQHRKDGDNAVEIIEKLMEYDKESNSFRLIPNWRRIFFDIWRGRYTW